MTEAPDRDYRDLERRLRQFERSRASRWRALAGNAADAIASFRDRAEEAERERDKWREDYITVNAALADHQEAQAQAAR